MYTDMLSISKFKEVGVTLRTFPVEGEAVQPGAGAAGEVGEVTARVGGDEGSAPTASHWSVHHPVVCDELQLIKSNTFSRF